MKNNLKSIIEKESPKFADVNYELPFWSAPFGLTLLDTVKLKPGMKALDIGCGNGFPLFELAGRLCKDSKIYGIDSYDKAIAEVNRKISVFNQTNAEGVLCAAEELQFENDFFDLIVSNNGINNVQDLNKTLSECYRVLKPGGQFVFTFNLPESLKEFYNVFKSTLEGLGLLNEIQKVNEHIFEKRKPVEYMKKIVIKNNFKISGIIENKFNFKFVNGTAFFDNFFFKFRFLPSWISILPEQRVDEVFTIVEEKLNEISSEKDGLVMTIPYACFECEK